MPDPTEFIRVDLGALYSVSRVNLNWENNGKSYVIETSLDGTTWTPAYRTSTGIGKGVDEVTFAATSARFVRVSGTLRANEFGYSLYELQIFAAGNPTNLALNKKVTASSVEKAGLEPELAVDGDAKTRWASSFGRTEYQCCTPANTTDANIGANGWHEYGIDWLADRMEFFVDGNVYHIHYFNDGAAFGTVDGQNEEGLVLVDGQEGEEVGVLEPLPRVAPVRAQDVRHPERGRGRQQLHLRRPAGGRRRHLPRRYLRRLGAGLQQPGRHGSFRRGPGCRTNRGLPEPGHQ